MWPFGKMRSRRRSASAGNPRRRFSLERLETRTLFAATLVNSLDEVVVSESGIRIVPGAVAGPEGKVLVVTGTSKNDTIQLRPGPQPRGGVDLVMNGAVTSFADPICAIVVHTGSGNNSVSVSPSLAIDAYLFGGTGGDTIVGGGGDDVVIGGNGNDSLSGESGRDIVFGGKGSDAVYGKTRASVTGDSENILYSESFRGEYNLPMLRDLASRWTNDAPLADRGAAVQQVLTAPKMVVDNAADKLYRASTADLITAVAAKGDRVSFALPGIENTWYSGPYRDAQGFDFYTVESPYQASATNVRVLLPAAFDASKTYRVVYVLPVESGAGSVYGDGLATVRAGGLQNSYNTIFVAPTFSAVPWYVNSTTSQTIWQETYFRTAVVPMVDQLYPVLAAPEGRLLLGFSKSGLGAFSMLLRHPDEFGRAWAFDSPLNISNPRTFPDFATVLGSSQNYENYRLSNLLSQQAENLRNRPPRLFMMGYNLCASHLQAVDSLMNQLQIPHVYLPGIRRQHVWQSGWVPEAVKYLLSDLPELTA